MSKEILQKLIKCVNVMLSTTQERSSLTQKDEKCETQPENVLQKVFKKKLEDFKNVSQELNVWDIINNEALLIDTDVDMAADDHIWSFVKLCLKLLLVVHSTVNDIISTRDKSQRQQPDSLGVKDLKSVSGLIQLVITCGVWPNLLKGVGKPMSLLEERLNR